jgi:hypothetical protein
MSSVIVDGEEVKFEGDVPLDPSQIYGLLMDALSEQSRVVVSFAVDGKDALQDDQFPAGYEKIEASSLTHDELTFRLTIETMNKLNETEAQLEAYVKNILSIPWSEVFGRMDEFISKIQPFAELLDNLGPYANAYEPPWEKKLREISVTQAESLGNILTAFEQANPAKLSDELSTRFIQVFKKSRKLFAEVIIPYLKERVEAK